MKVTIELEVNNEFEAERLKRYANMLSDPNWMASWWHIDDIHECADGWDGDEDEHELTDEEAQKVLRLLEKYHDCEVGICWDVIDNWIEEVKSHRKVEA